MKSNVLYYSLLLTLGACNGIWGSGDGERVLTERTYFVDEIKLIEKGHFDPYSESHYMQDLYVLDSDKRLLLRRQDFSDFSEEIITDSENDVRLTVGFRGTAPADVENYVKLCPLLQNWMMGSTWVRRHTLGSNGQWRKKGGTFDSTSCLTGSIVEEEGSLSFDITDWVINYLRGRNKNYGWILISSDTQSEFEIIGENSNSSNAPRVRWMQ